MAVQRYELWPKAAVGAYLASSSETKYVYTRAFLTTSYTEVVVQLECDAEIGDQDARIIVTPQVSNDGNSWQDLTAFTAITEGGTYPVKEVLKFTTVGSFLRCQIALDITAGQRKLVVGTILIVAVGRSEE